MFIATVMALSTLAMPTSISELTCAAGTTLVTHGDRPTAPSMTDIRRVWARFLAAQKKAATAKEDKARVATRIEELVAALKELEDASDENRASELQKRVAALIERLQSDLDIDSAPAVVKPSPTTLLDEIKGLLENHGSHRFDSRRVAGLLRDLKALLTAAEKENAKDAPQRFEVVFLSSLAQAAARTDASDPCSAGPDGIKDFQRYFTEMYDLFESAKIHVPLEVKEAMRRLNMRPRIVAQLLPSMVLDGTASVLQPAAQIQWRTRYLHKLGLTWNTDGGIGYGPAVVVLDPTPAKKITQEETVTTTTDANGQTRQTRTVTSSGSFTCSYVTRVVDGVSKEVCDPPKPGEPKLGLQNSFQWFLGLQAGRGFERGERAGEIRVFGRAQMSNPTASFVITEDKTAKDTGSTALASIDSEARWAFETGVRLAIYDRDRQESRERSGLRPAMSLAYGLRWDKRLAGTGIDDAGANSERRQFLRLALTKVPVFQDNGDFFNLTFGIDREWASFYGRKDNHLPGVTRLFIQANIDFLKALGKP